MGVFSKRKKTGWLSLMPIKHDICITHVIQTTGKPRVVYCDYRHGTLTNESNLKSLTQQLGLSNYHCIALLGFNEYQLLQLEKPAVPPQELKQASRWKIKDMIDYAVDEATIDVLEIPTDNVNSNKMRYIFAVSVHNKIIRRCITQYIEQAGITLEVIDIPELSQRNIAALLEEPDKGLATLSISAQGGLLTFTAGGELYHARQIDFDINQILAINSERQNMIFDRIALDLQRSLDSFERQFPYIHINRLMLAPFPARDSLLEFLESYLSLKIETFELSTIFDFDDPFSIDDTELASKILLPLGAALRQSVTA